MLLFITIYWYFLLFITIYYIINRRCGFVNHYLFDIFEMSTCYAKEYKYHYIGIFHYIFLYIPLHNEKNIMTISNKSIAEQILDVLRETHGTVKDLSITLDLSENVVRTTINRMKKRNLIQETGIFRTRYKVFRISKPEEIKTDGLSGLDGEILKKMLLPFARKGIKMRFTHEEQNRVKELFSQTYNSKGEPH